MRNSLGRRLAAIAGAGTVALAGLAAVGAANATTATDIPTTQGTLVITKYEGSGDTGNRTGTQADAPTGKKPLQGAGFTVCPVVKDGAAINLDTADGWATAAEVVTSTGSIDETKFVAKGEKEGTKVFHKGTCKAEQKTDQTGVTTFSNLEHTLYYVYESTKPDQVTDPAAPFFVTIPFANTGADKATNPWLTTVYVYPKNVVINTEDNHKSAGDINKVYVNGENSTGDQLNPTLELPWTITTKLPATLTKLTALGFEDTFTNGATYKADSLEVKIGTADYTSSFTATPSDSNKKLTVTLTDAPKEKLTPKDGAEVNVSTLAGQTVTFKFTVVLDKDQMAATLTNTANVTINDSTVSVSSKDNDNNGKDKQPNFAKFKVTKRDSSSVEGTPVTLQGAKFQLYEATAGNAGAFTLGNAVSANDSAASAKSANGVYYTTDRNGEALATLYVGAGATKTKSYCLVEVEAPKGYKVPDGDDKNTCFTLASDTNFATPLAVNITNTKVGNGWNAGLPLTGAQGLLVLSLGGAALIGLGVFAVVVIRRRQQEEE